MRLLVVFYFFELGIDGIVSRAVGCAFGLLGTGGVTALVSINLLSQC